MATLIAEDDPMRGQRWPIAIACAMAIASVAVVASVRLSGATIHEPDAATVATRELRFLDRPDGSIAVIDARTERQVDAIVGQNGFVRGTLRGLARERKRQGIGPEAPFDLVVRADGRLTLLDPSTGRRVDLESFGPTNLAEFSRLLSSSGQSNAASPLPRS